MESLAVSRCQPLKTASFGALSGRQAAKRGDRQLMSTTSVHHPGGHVYSTCQHRMPARFRGAQKFNSSDDMFADKSWIATYPFWWWLCLCSTTSVANHADSAPSQLVFSISCKRPKPLARIPGRMLRLLSVPAPGVSDWPTRVCPYLRCLQNLR